MHAGPPLNHQEDPRNGRHKQTNKGRRAPFKHTNPRIKGKSEEKKPKRSPSPPQGSTTQMPSPPPSASRGSKHRSQQTLQRRPKPLAPYQRPTVIEAEISGNAPQETLNDPTGPKMPCRQPFPQSPPTPPFGGPAARRRAQRQQRTTTQGFANVVARTTSWVSKHKSLINAGSIAVFAISPPTP